MIDWVLTGFSSCLRVPPTPSKTDIPAFNPGDVKIRFNQVDMTGRIGPMIEDDATAYMSLVVSSVPRNNDRCFPPDPSQPWLELFAQPFRPVKSKSELKRNVLVSVTHSDGVM